jgi:hypothetical protein
VSEPTTTSPTCARCGTTLTAGAGVEASGRLYCRSCYETLAHELRQAVAAMSTDVNYPLAAVGALAGGALGVLAWWGFTVMTRISFGLVAVAIGYLVGHGAMRLSGGKRTRGLQILAIVVAALCFFVATYLVNMTFINAALSTRGDPRRLPFPPLGVEQFVRVVAARFGVMDVVFLGIVVWQAWSILRPVRLNVPAA